MNPWGEREWTGPWHDHDQRWDELTMAAAEFQSKGDDGLF